MTVRIGEIVVTAGLVTPEQLHEAREQQRKTGCRLGVLLVELGHLTEPQVTDAVAKQYGLPAVHDLDTREVAKDVLMRVPREHCQSHCVVPLSRQGAVLQMAMADPTNVFAMALREFLRQDPNIILVGEIRDYETAEIEEVLRETVR